MTLYCANAPRRYKREPQDLDSKYSLAMEMREKFFEWDGGTEANGRWLFKDGMEGELDIPSLENTSEIDALKDLADWWDDIGKEGFSENKPYELFATLSLWMLAEALEWIGTKYPIVATFRDGTTITSFIEHINGDSAWRLSAAIECTLKAMEAVCFAEHLQQLEKMEAIQTQNEMSKQKLEREKRSDRGRELNIARHQKRNEAQAKVIEEWEKSPSQFPSAEKAGRHYSDWLLKQEFEFEPRTVTGWIREHAKRVGVKFR
ncbi:MAG: hypothetical protein IPP03_16115 [Dechloromonas sp.]|jgi:hypothetical protein|nr:hypothetical protein [Candidatus Dechloromonas phosphoritropha]